MSTELLSRESIAQHPGGLWDYISPSRLNLWLKCPLAFRLKYLDRVEIPASPAAFLGKAVHHGLELYYRNRQLGIELAAEDVLRRLRESWGTLVADERATFESAEDEEGLKTKAVDLVAAYLKQVPPEEPLPLAVEASVTAPLVDPLTSEDLGIPLLGIMDLVLDGPSGAIIADFKTTARSSEPLEVVHEVQLTSYAWLCRHVSDNTEAGLEIRSLVKTKTPKVEMHQYPARTERHFRRLFAVLREYLDALDSCRFNYRPGWGCGMCDFCGEQCRAWQG